MIFIKERKAFIIAAIAAGVFLTLWASLLVRIAFWDFYKPKVNPNERWVSSNPDISFSFLTDTEDNNPFGRIIVNDKAIGISPTFDYGNRLYVFCWPATGPGYRANEDILIHGSCDFHKDYFVVTVEYDRDGLFEGIDTITFRKELVPDDEPWHGEAKLQIVNEIS